MHLSLTRIQGAVNWFGEIEVVCSLIKFGWIFVVIISGIVRTSFHHTLSTT
jgi:L-asparagine transporter-like permease